MPPWSGFWNSVNDDGHSLIGKPSVNKRLRRALRGVTAAKQREILRTLVTDDVGTTALATHTRIAAQDHENYMTSGGVRSVETVTDINRAVTSADETEMLNEIDGVHTPTFPDDLSGNGGGGKLGF